MEEEKLFHIGVCDDEEFYRKQIREYSEAFLKKIGLPYCITEFSSAEEILQNLERKENKIHLLFLDIEMKGMSGIELLRHLGETDLIWRIAFVSSHEDRVWDTFGIKTLDFLRKPVSEERVKKDIQIAVDENNENILLQYTRDASQKEFVSLEDIYCMEAKKNNTILHKRTEKILTHESLKCWEEKTKGINIIRVHRGYLVNLLHVTRLQGGVVTLENGEQIPIGRFYAKTVKEKQFEFLREKAGKRI